MGSILEFWRIPIATFFSLVLVTGAYFLAKDARAPSRAEASPESALLKAIASRDADADGLADWEEALYGTDPKVVDTKKLGMSDGEAVERGLIVPKAVADVPAIPASPSGQNEIDETLPPAPADDTVTAVFAEQFLALYLSAKEQKGGEDLTEEEMQIIATQALEGVSGALGAAPDFKAAKDLKKGESGRQAMVAFAAAAEAVLLANPSGAEKSEIFYLTDVVKDGDASALEQIARIAKAYRTSAVGLAALPVPPELAAADLAIINAMVKVSRINEDFTKVNSDPLVAMLALQQYPKAVLALGSAFIELGKVYREANIIFREGGPGASFVNLMQDVADEQEAAANP